MQVAPHTSTCTVLNCKIDRIIIDVLFVKLILATSSTKAFITFYLIKIGTILEFLYNFCEKYELSFINLKSLEVCGQKFSNDRAEEAIENWSGKLHIYDYNDYWYILHVHTHHRWSRIMAPFK